MASATEIVDIVKAFFNAIISVFEGLKDLFSKLQGDDTTASSNEANG